MPSVFQQQDVIGSYVVFDPTGRDFRSCYEVGRVEAVTWDDGDDGNPDGSPRPLLIVVPNGSEERVAVATVAVVIPLTTPYCQTK